MRGSFECPDVRLFSLRLSRAWDSGAPELFFGFKLTTLIREADNDFTVTDTGLSSERVDLVPGTIALASICETVENKRIIGFSAKVTFRRETDGESGGVRGPAEDKLSMVEDRERQSIDEPSDSSPLDVVAVEESESPDLTR